MITIRNLIFSSTILIPIFGWGQQRVMVYYAYFDSNRFVATSCDEYVNNKWYDFETKIKGKEAKDSVRAIVESYKRDSAGYNISGGTRTDGRLSIYLFYRKDVTDKVCFTSERIMHVNGKEYPFNKKLLLLALRHLYKKYGRISDDRLEFYINGASSTENDGQ